MKLSLRLETIKKMVPYSICCDVGADHGKLIIALAEEGLIHHGFAIENKIGPFTRLKENVENSLVKDKITCLLSDGIKDIPNEVTTLVLAGMGGSLICSILKKDITKLEHINTIIVDGHTEVPLLREEITKLGFQIADEKIIREKEKFYEIIKFVRSSVTFLNDLDKNFGPILRNEKSSLFKEKYNNRIDEIEHILALPNVSIDKINKLKKEEMLIRSIL